MQIEEPFDFPDDEAPIISDALRSNLYKMLRGTNRIIIEEEVTANKYRKVNSIRLNCKSGRMPEESVDEISEAVMQVVHWHWLDAVEQAGEIEDSSSHRIRYRMACIKTEGRKAKRSVYSFWYSMNLDEEDREEVQTIEQETLKDLLDDSMRANDLKQVYIEHLHETILDTLKANNQPLSSAGQLLTLAGSMATSGLQATVNALQMQYNSAKAEAEEKGKTARMTAAFNTVAPFIGLGLQQFIERKMGQKVDLGSAMSGLGVDPEDMQESEEPREPDFDEEEMAKQQQENPIAFAARAFGESLSPKQQLDMNKKLSKKQVEAILSVTTCETDDEVVEKINDLQGLFPPEKYPALLAMLDSQQQQLLMHVVSSAANR